MKKMDLNQTLSVIANIGILIGLGLVAFELNQNTKQLALELQWQVNERMIQNNRDLLGDNPAGVFVKSVLTPDDLSFEEFQIASALLFNFLGVWEDRYFLYEAGLAADSEWKSFVDDDIDFTLGYAFAQDWWEETKHVFEPELVEYVDRRLPAVSAEANHAWWQRTLSRLSARDRRD